VDDRHKLKEEGPLRIQLYPMSKLATSNGSISSRLFTPDPQDTFRLMRLMGMEYCPGMILWKVSCTGVNSAKLRPISMKVFLMIKFSEAPLSISEVPIKQLHVSVIFWSK
jgi:hypothetical protein